RCAAFLSRGGRAATGGTTGAGRRGADGVFAGAIQDGTRLPGPGAEGEQRGASADRPGADGEEPADRECGHGDLPVRTAASTRTRAPGAARSRCGAEALPGMRQRDGRPEPDATERQKADPEQRTDGVVGQPMAEQATKADSGSAGR